MLRSCASCGALGHRKCPACGANIHANKPSAASAALLLLGLAACDGSNEVVALYGAPVTDQDGDGYPAGEDCDDTDPDVYPDAPETPGDEVDSNCDGSDDT